jgi:hypothetical protein
MLDDPMAGKWPIAIEAGYIAPGPGSALIDHVERPPDRF